MEEQLVSLLQDKFDNDGEDDDNQNQQSEESSFLFADKISESYRNQLQTQSENLKHLMIFSLIFCATNFIIVKMLIRKGVNLNQIFGFRANSSIIQNMLLLFLSFTVYTCIMYGISLLEIMQITGMAISKYAIQFLYLYLCYLFFSRVKSDALFFLTQIKQQKNISFTTVFMSDQLLTISPLLLQTIHLINYLMTINIPLVKYTVHALALSKVMRIYQCIRLYSNDSQKSKDILSHTDIQNCIKYLVSLMCIILDQFLVYKWSIDYGLLISHVCYSIYTFYWDVYEDWGLNISNYKYFSSEEFLNRRPLFSKKLYIFSLLFNAIVRLNWAVKYILSATHHQVDFYVYCFEISRRSLWNLHKLEYESYLLKEKSDLINRKSEVELQVVSSSLKITFDESSSSSSPTKPTKQDDLKRNL